MVTASCFQSQYAQYYSYKIIQPKRYPKLIAMYLIGTTADGGGGGGNFHRKSINLNTGAGEEMEKAGSIEEFFVHEGTHASLDGFHAKVSS